MKRIDLKLGMAALALLLPAGGSWAQTYVKQGTGGNLTTNAYVAYGSGALTEIDGVFSTSSATSTQGIPDLFAINILSGTPFSATTVDTGGSAYDTQLFLFSSTGNGIYYNDDDINQLVGAGATLPADYLPSGLYYLGISPEGAIPQSTAGNIFPNPETGTVSFTGVYGASGVGGALPLSKWNVTSDDVEAGSYTILLTGATFVAAPEPSSVAALLIGGMLLGATAWRKRRVSTATSSQERIAA